jgi:hemin uptake protein HemP
MTGNRSDQSSAAHARKAADTMRDETTQNKLPCIVSLDFEELAQGQHCILIRLAGETYTLRKTQSGKLILNK